MSDNSVVVKRQNEIQIFFNEDEGISLVQINEYGDFNVVDFHLEYAEDVAMSILNLFHKNRTAE